MRWDLARLWHTIAEQQPQRPALIHGARQLTWQQFDTAAAAFTATLRRAGISRGDVVALCLPNTLEFLVLLAGALRCGASACGVNYRYRPHERAALLRHLRPAVVCRLTGTDPGVPAAEVPGVRLFCDVNEATAGSLDQLLGAGADRRELHSHPDDVLLKCTGGTTGTPIAVRWRIGDVLEQLNRHNPWHQHDLTARALTPVADSRVRLLVASPLMHGSGLTRALGALCAAGTVITVPGAAFNAARLLDAVAEQHATALAVAGDAHAVPLADALDADPHRWALPELATITSSGATWTREVKQRLLKHLPQLRLTESLGATEATGLGFNVATAGHVPATGEFSLGAAACIFTDHGVPARRGQTGVIGVSAPHPVGLHPTGQLPAERFVTHDGHRYLLSGDHVQAVDDRRFMLLGRPDDCINTGGEKVYAPEVAEALLRHPGVRDATVLGIPHPRLGSTVTALVQIQPGTTVSAVTAHARRQLAGFKVPTTIIAMPTIPRTTAGKPDLAAARRAVTEHRRRIAPSDRLPATHRWDFVALARREQALLTAALASLFTDRKLDTRISQALGYPAWPQPLTLLPQSAPELVTATPQLAAYLAFAITAGRDTIAAITETGWPDHPAAADAAWLLLQHADADNQQRGALIPHLTAAVHRGDADPRHLALLTDRERAVRGEAQRYGTLRLIRDDRPALLYPLAGSPAEVDTARRAIGLPDLAADAQFAFSPLTPYGTARTSPTNPWQPRSLGALRAEPDVAAPADQPDPLPPGTVGVYLGATLRYRNQICRVRDRLPPSLISTGRWLDIDPLTRASCQLDAGLALNQLAARLCLTDAARSDVLIAFAEHRRSHGLGVEIGVGLAHHKRVIIIGAPSCSFDMLPDVTIAADLDEALAAASSHTGNAPREPV